MIGSTKASRRTSCSRRMSGPRLEPRCLWARGLSEDNERDEIVIGISLPLTGDFSEPGKGVQRGYEAWAKYVNENGGLLGKQVKLEILDDQSSADRVASDYEKLINQEKVDLVFGPFSTRLVIPAAQVAKDYGFLFVEPAGAAEEVFTAGFDNLFYAAPAIADDHYNLLAEQIIGMPEATRPKTAAYASMDDPFAQGTAYGLKEKLEAAGIKTVADEVYPPDTTDFGSVAAKIADSKAEILVGGTQYQDAVNLIVALQQLNYQPKLAAFSTAPTNPEFPAAIGSKTEGILSPTGYTPEATYPENKEFVKFYTELNDAPPAEDEANAWTTGEVVAAAVEDGRVCRSRAGVPAEDDRLPAGGHGRHRRGPAELGRGRPAAGCPHDPAVREGQDPHRHAGGPGRGRLRVPEAGLVTG